MYQIQSQGQKEIFHCIHYLVKYSDQAPQYQIQKKNLHTHTHTHTHMYTHESTHIHAHSFEVCSIKGLSFGRKDYTKELKTVECKRFLGLLYTVRVSTPIL